MYTYFRTIFTLSRIVAFVPFKTTNNTFYVDIEEKEISLRRKREASSESERINKEVGRLFT